MHIVTHFEKRLDTLYRQLQKVLSLNASHGSKPKRTTSTKTIVLVIDYIEQSLFN